MRFYNYITENLKSDKSIEEINNMVQKDCKYYLDITKGKYIFNRGMYEDSGGIKKVRQNRKPSGMDEDVFKLFNKGLKKNKHVRRDKAVMATSGNTELFGRNNIIFPIGKFNYTGVKSRDINLNDKRTGGHPLAVDEFLKYGKILNLFKNKPFNSYFTTNKGIEEAGENGYEIGFDCKKYYGFYGYDFKGTGKELIKT